MTLRRSVSSMCVTIFAIVLSLLVRDSTSTACGTTTAGCTVGSYCASSLTGTAGTCTACPAGSWIETANGLTPASPATTQTALQACKMCTKGRVANPNFNNLGAISTDCEVTGGGAAAYCPAGTFASWTSGIATDAVGGVTGCTTCAKGSYAIASTSGAGVVSSCTACAAGSYYELTGGTSSAVCKTCTIGAFPFANDGNPTAGAIIAACNTALTTATFCPAGTYSSIDSAFSKCIPCPAGTYSLASTADKVVTGCTPCLVGYSHATFAASDPTYITDTPTGIMTSTPIGATEEKCTGYARGGTAGAGATDSTGGAVTTTVTYCQSGKYGSFATDASTAGAPSGYASCISCPANTYAIDINTALTSAKTCTPLTSGFKIIGAGSGATALLATAGTACPAGSYTGTLNGNAACVLCEPGNTCPSGSTSQAACTTGYSGYGSTVAANSCVAVTSCPAGYACSASGTSKVCAPGSWSVAGTATSTSTSCTSCPATEPYTSFNPYKIGPIGTATSGVLAGTTTAAQLVTYMTLATAATSCTNLCPAGYSCNYTSQTPCPAGYFSPAATSIGGAMTCAICSPGTFSGTGASSCIPCASLAAGTPYSTAGSSISSCSVNCPNGYTCPTSLSATTFGMSLCPAGTYSSAGLCQPCPANAWSIAGTYGSCTVYPSPPPYPFPPSPPSPPNYPPKPPTPPVYSPPDAFAPFPPAPPGIDLPTGNPASAAAATPRKNGDKIVTVPQSTTLVLSPTACGNVQNFTAAFVAAFQLTTFNAWNKANSAAAMQILQGDVSVPTATIQAFCSSSRRSLSATGSSVIISSAIQTPSVTTPAQAEIASSTYSNGYAQKAYSSSDFSSQYKVSSATTFTLPVTTITYTDAAPPPPPASFTSSSSTNTNVGLVAGLSVGLFIAGALIAGAAVFMVTKRGSQSVEPK